MHSSRDCLDAVGGRASLVRLEASMRTKLLAVLEVVLVFAVMQTVVGFWTSTTILQWEKQHLGWSYVGGLILVGLPALVLWLTRRNWAEYGVSLANWRTNLEIGMKGYLVAFIPYVFGWLIAPDLGLDPLRLGGVWIAFSEAIALALMLWMMSRQKAVGSARKNVTIASLCLCLPIVMALAMGELNTVIVSTVLWQLVFSGFGEELLWRGYVQSRLNQALGRPWRLFGIQFGAGLIIASALFGVQHALNTYKPALGLASLSWGWGLSTFVGGLMFGAIREKTGTLLAPGIAHGLPDAVGEALTKVIDLM